MCSILHSIKCNFLFSLIKNDLRDSVSKKSKQWSKIREKSHTPFRNYTSAREWNPPVDEVILYHPISSSRIPSHPPSRGFLRGTIQLRKDIQTHEWNRRCPQQIIQPFHSFILSSSCPWPKNEDHMGDPSTVQNWSSTHNNDQWSPGPTRKYLIEFLTVSPCRSSNRFLIYQWCEQEIDCLDKKKGQRQFGHNSPTPRCQFIFIQFAMILLVSSYFSLIKIK